MTGDFDLLGWGKRSRPSHIAMERNRNKIRLLLASNTRIARALSITCATLRKHYFSELRQRAEALTRPERSWPRTAACSQDQKFG